MNLNGKPLNPALPAEKRENAAVDAPVAPNTPDPAYVAKATRAAEEFESFFISQVLHQMRATTRELAPEDSPYRDKVNADMQDMADDILAGKMAGQRAFGIADAILRQLLPHRT